MSTQPPLTRFENKKGVNSENIEIVNAVARGSIDDTEKGKPMGTVGGIEIDTDRVLKVDDLDNEQFMRDELEVMFSEPMSENEPGFVECTVNGDYVMAVRGYTTKLRRYHVAVLAQAKIARVKQKKIVNPDGSMGFQEEVVLSLVYPFQVMNDPRPAKGVPWLRQLLQTPA